VEAHIPEADHPDHQVETNIHLDLMLSDLEVEAPKVDHQTHPVEVVIDQAVVVHSLEAGRQAPQAEANSHLEVVMVTDQEVEVLPPEEDHRAHLVEEMVMDLEVLPPEEDHRTHPVEVVTIQAAEVLPQEAECRPLEMEPAHPEAVDSLRTMEAVPDRVGHRVALI